MAATTAADSRDMSALTQRSQEVRRERRETRDWIRSAPTSRDSRERVIELLRDPPEHLLNIEVRELLLMPAGTGEITVNRILEGLRVSRIKSVRDVTDRQASEISEIYLERAQRYQLVFSPTWGSPLQLEPGS